MSTRSTIARHTSPGKFVGVYHHWDGYPEGLGATLFGLYNGFFGRDLGAMLKLLIDDHPGGWSTINGADMSLAPGYTEWKPGAAIVPDGEKRPACYCHGDRAEEGWVITEENASGSGCEWAYVFATSEGGKDQMLVMSSYTKSGARMIGAFGFGAPDAEWKPVAIVDLNGPEPDWERMTKDAYGE